MSFNVYNLPNHLGKKMYFNNNTNSNSIINHLRITMLKLQTEIFMYHFIFLQDIKKRSLIKLNMNNQPPSIVLDIQKYC